MSETISDEDFDKVVFATRKVADELQVIIETIIRENKVGDAMLFQGQICHILSSYILNISIKILEKHGTTPDRIDLLCEDAIHMAKNMATIGELKEAKDH